MHRASYRGFAAAFTALATATLLTAGGSASAATLPATVFPADDSTLTPIQHVVVIFDENISFDHYFASYPKATNTDGTKFVAAKHTPKANNLVNAGLLKQNPNLYRPTRLSPSQAMTCDQNHNYGAEQKAANGGKNDLYVQNTSVDTCTGQPVLFGAPGLTMDYYDGNTVTALWNYAQHFSLNDNSFGSVYGPSTPGALELVSGQTHGVQAVTSVTHEVVPIDTYAVMAPDANGVGTMINDPDPAYDDCSDKNHTATNNLAQMLGKNVGDLLNAQDVSWGWFQGGFKPTTAASGTAYAVCGATHNNVGGVSVVDYSPHHNPFAYYQSTANPKHLAPSSVWAIGHDDQANHNYDLSDFDAALKVGNLPSVSFLKAPEYQDGHAGYSDPLDEQHFLVSEINQIQSSKFWKNTAIVVAYDDSDGWYDHQSSPLKNGSNDPVNDVAACVKAATTVGVAGGYQDRCGPGTRQPLLVISPFARTNYIDHTPTEQTSITRFIEDNWHLGRIGDHSFDTRAKPLYGMFDFWQFTGPRVLLRQDGSVKSVSKVCTVSFWWWNPCR